jgi:hypothetical protein
MNGIIAHPAVGDQDHEGSSLFCGAYRGATEDHSTGTTGVVNRGVSGDDEHTESTAEERYTKNRP